MSDRPTLVFVPGSWHKPTCYTKVTDALEGQRHLKCIAITLPSTTGNPESTFEDDLDVARTAIASEIMSGRNVVVIAHSYGGMVANSAIKDYTLPLDGDASRSSLKQLSYPISRESPSPVAVPGHVVGLVLIASGFTLTGLSFMDPLFGVPPPSWRVNRETGFADIVASPRQLFYHDLPEDEADVWVSQLTPQSLKALFEGGEHAYAGWMHVHVWYIGTTEDQCLPVILQRMHVGMARGMGAVVEHRELRSSHSPFLSQPNEIVDLLVEATALFTGKTVEGTRVEGRDNEVLMPVASIWHPCSWFKYALPLAFGFGLGRCLHLFYGARKLWLSSFSSKPKTT